MHVAQLRKTGIEFFDAKSTEASSISAVQDEWTYQDKREQGQTNDFIWLKQLPVKEDEAQPKIVVETIIDENNGESSLLRIEGRFTNAQLKKWFSIIEKNVVRTRPNVNSKALPRKTAWFTLKGCNCPYGYSGTHWEPTEFPRWLEELTNLVSKEIGGTCEWGCRPNSCNINLYEDGQDHVGW